MNSNKYTSTQNLQNLLHLEPILFIAHCGRRRLEFSSCVNITRLYFDRSPVPTSLATTSKPQPNRR